MNSPYYLGLSRNNSLHGTSSLSRFKSISVYGPEQASVLGQKIKINDLSCSNKLLKGRILYESEQFKRPTQTKIKQEIRESQTEVLIVINLELMTLEAEYNKIAKGCEYSEDEAFSQYIEVKLNCTENSVSLLKRKSKLLQEVETLKKQIYIDQVQISVQENSSADIESQIKQSKLTMRKLDTQIAKGKLRHTQISREVQHQSEKLIQFYSSMSSSQNMSSYDQICENMNDKIEKNTKIINDYVLIAQQQSNMNLQLIQDIQNDIVNAQAKLQQYQSQLFKLKIDRIKVQRILESSLDNSSISDDQ